MPGFVRPSAMLFNELSSVLELLVVHSCPVVIGGDFNIMLRILTLMHDV